MSQVPSEDRQRLSPDWQAPPPQAWQQPSDVRGLLDGDGERPGRQWNPQGSGTDAFPVPWRWWDAIMVYVLAFMAAVLAMIPLMLLAREDLAVPLSIAVQGGLMLATTLLWIGLRYRGELRRLLGPERARVTDALVGLLGGVSAFFLVNVLLGSLLTIIAEQLGFEVPEIQQNLREFIQDPTLGWLAIGVAVLLAPVGEELLFRGILFQSLRSRMPLLPAIALSSVAFGLVHYEPLLIVLTSLVGALLAWLFHIRGSLVTPIVAHAVYNAISVVILLLTAGTG
jgi:uncharacterized protein